MGRKAVAQTGPRAVAAVHLDAALASAQAARALVAGSEPVDPAAVVSLLRAAHLGLEAASELLTAPPAEAPAPGAGCPKCGAPAARQTVTSGMGDGPTILMCRDCGEEHEQT